MDPNRPINSFHLILELLGQVFIGCVPASVMVRLPQVDLPYILKNQYSGPSPDVHGQRRLGNANPNARAVLWRGTSQWCLSRSWCTNCWIRYQKALPW